MKADGVQISDAGVPSYDLTDRPWLPVLRLDGGEELLSLREVFARAGQISRLIGDVPTQEYALTRLLLAVLHDAVDGPKDMGEWEDLWADDDPFGAVPGYLDEHRERFDLLHPATPFFQVAGLRTANDDVFSLNRIVADVPNGVAFFSMRSPGADRISFDEAARWVVHTQAYDTSGIKSGTVGDPRTKAGKAYPQGVAWAGNLGGVIAEGATLRETLLLNLIAADSGVARARSGDRPAWRRAPGTPGASEDLASRPTGLRDLYTWQSRRLRLHFDADGVHGVVLTYGDPLAQQNMHPVEPMTGWRRSQAQEKKLGEPVVYMPREHDPARAAWRGLAALITDRAGSTGVRGEPPSFLRPGIVDWLARLVTDGQFARGTKFRVRTVGALYGTQQSVIDEITEDTVMMDVILLSARDRRLGQAAVDAVADADAAVNALSNLASDLARAAGREPGSAADTARDLGFGALDGLYRTWLASLADGDDPGERRAAWQRTADGCIRTLGKQLLAGAGEAAWEGRVITAGKGELWLNSSSADLWFRSRLTKALPLARPTDPPAPPVPVSTDPAPDGTALLPDRTPRTLQEPV